MDTAITFLQEIFGSINVAAIVAVFVLVWLWGQLGLEGKGQLLSSFITGVVVGVADKFFNGALADGSAWFMAVIYGVILGGLASGAYEGIKKAVSRSMVETLEITAISKEPPRE